LPKSNIHNTTLWNTGHLAEACVRLTLYTDYALRLLMYLALKQDGLATVAEIAQRYDISRNHLMKVAYELGAAGFVETVRGRRGGLRLAQAPQSIRIGDVVRRTEPDMALVSCFVPIDGPCVLKRCCVLRGALEHATATFLETLDGYSLADLVRPRGRLGALLAIAPAQQKGAAHAH
jgi:Rrf2 family nitric oxide-sensitive transcriptional repressor